MRRGESLWAIDVRRGESLWAIDVRRGEITLTPAGSWDVAGGPDASSWIYRIDTFGPSGNVTRIYPSESVCHFRYAPSPETPWTSPSPLGYARATGKLAANLELRLAEEAGSRVGFVLPVPADGGSGDAADPLASLKKDLAALSGNTALVETVAAGWGEGRAAAPQSDWKAQRMGANPPPALAELRGAAAADILSIHGISPALASGQSEGTSQREGWRRLGLAMQAIGLCVAAELADKLNAPGLRIKFGALHSADMAGRSRAAGILVKAGMNLEKATKLVGLEG